MSLNGVEKTFKEPQVAAMTGLKKGPLYEMLGQATKGRLAGSRPAVDTTANRGQSPSQGQNQPSGGASHHIRMEDSSLATDHLTPGLPPGVSPKTVEEATLALRSLVQESDTLSLLSTEIDSRLNFLWSQIAPNPASPPIKRVMNSITIINRQNIVKEIRILETQGKEIKSRQSALATQARKTLAIPQSQRGKVRFFDAELENVNAEMRKAWQTGRQGALLVEQYIHPSLLPEVTFTSDTAATRSAYLHQDDNGVSRRLVILNTNEAGVITAMHEITHAVECREVTEWSNNQPTLRQPLYKMARAFLLKRSNGMPGLTHLI